MEIKRFDIFYANLGKNIGSEQGGVRPVLIIQNDIGNKYSPTTIVAPITSQFVKCRKNLPTHVVLESDCSKLDKESIILFEQIRVIDKQRLRRKVVSLHNADKIEEIDTALRISLSLTI